jgi:hypothetical protein
MNRQYIIIGLGVVALGAAALLYQYQINADELVISPIAACDKTVALTQFTWEINPDTKGVRLLNRSKTPEFVCQKTIEIGGENAQIAIIDSTGKTIYQKKVIVDLEKSHTEGQAGGVISKTKATDESAVTLFTTYLPWNPEIEVLKPTVRFTLLGSGSNTDNAASVEAGGTLAEGKL